MDDTVEKLLDLVCNTNDPAYSKDTALNAVTPTEGMPLNIDTLQTSDTPILTSDNELNGVPDSTTTDLANEYVTPLNTEDTMGNDKTDAVDTSIDQHSEFQQSMSSHLELEPIGHETCTTTDEEEAVEALLALSTLPDNRTEQNDLYDNKELMLIGSPNTGVDANPVEIKLCKRCRKSD